MDQSTDAEKEKNSPLVSVVIPTYGRNEYLSDAVTSVIEQTYDPIELLIVDDCSPKPIIDSLSDVAFDKLHSTTFIRHNENRGANAARNSGIRAAAGTYLAFLDDDDYWDETKIEKQVAAFESADETVGVVYTGKQTSSPQGSTVTTPTMEGNVLRDLLKGESFGQFSSVMVKKEFIESAGLPDEQFPAWQDREWFFRLAQVCQFKPVVEPLAHRRVGHGERITTQFEKRRDIAYPLFVEKHYPTAREHGIYYARTFLASLRMNLGSSAVRAGQYHQARKYYWLSFLANPFFRPVHKHLLASLGGRWSYQAATKVRKKAIALRSFLE